jgi:geranylgeranyl pyrophosphate synthase
VFVRAPCCADEGDEAELGKRAGKDASRNKATDVSAFGLDHAKAPWR